VLAELLQREASSACIVWTHHCRPWGRGCSFSDELWSDGSLQKSNPCCVLGSDAHDWELARAGSCMVPS
jgi:hypothetical protein